jgi:hypothetical protein
MEESLSAKVGYSAALGRIDKVIDLLEKGSRTEKEEDWLIIAKTAYAMYQGSGNNEGKSKIGETILAYLNENEKNLRDIMIHDRDFLNLFDATRERYEWLDNNN